MIDLVGGPFCGKSYDVKQLTPRFSVPWPLAPETLSKHPGNVGTAEKERFAIYLRTTRRAQKTGNWIYEFLGPT